jgi:ABC-type polysaccharide/polyol phosphate transport system ATPase subunit
MTDTVIAVENLSKRYLVGHMSAKGYHSYTALRDVIARGAHNFVRKASDMLRGRQVVQGDEVEEFWALKDVSFEVKRGDVLGIIGRNGAGKSTLLKILSRITEPTQGRVLLRGRVASLLEVGTGFHPELTGRDNIFLNGAILGMTRREIRNKFDEIVAFAEVERFLDTPVKRYSSGMYVRLAFAVAAHLEPEILVVDEVLAVGDAKFQSKCLGKMSSVAKSGRTVVFVSHNMRAIQGLCTSAILLRNGNLVMEGVPQRCAEAYLQSGDIPDNGFADLATGNRVSRRGSGLCTFISFELLNQSGARSATFGFGEPFAVKITVLCTRKVQDVLLGFSFISSDGIEIMGTAAHDGGVRCNLNKGISVLECEISPMILTPGKFILRAAVFSRDEIYDHIDEILEFDVLDVPAARALVPQNHYVGLVHVPYKWKLETLTGDKVRAEI